MPSEDAALAYIIDTQIRIFDDARLDLQLSLPKIAEQARLPIGTVKAWAQGRNALSLWGVKKLLRVAGLAPLLSRLFEPEEFALIGLAAGTDHDEFAAHCRTFLRDHNDTLALAEMFAPLVPAMLAIVREAAAVRGGR